jgi:hypothetical protein
MADVFRKIVCVCALGLCGKTSRYMNTKCESDISEKIRMFLNKLLQTVYEICPGFKVRCTKFTVSKKTYTYYNLNNIAVIFINVSKLISSLRYVVTYPQKKLHSLSPRANYTDRATATCRRSDCQLLRIKSATWSAWWVPTVVFSVF